MEFEYLLCMMFRTCAVARDLKSENIRWSDSEGCIKLADFGSAYQGSTSVDESISMTTVVGTPGSCAPEVQAGGECY